MNIFLIYLLGVSISGLILISLTFIPSYYQFMIDNIKNVASNNEFDDFDGIIEINEEVILNSYIVILSLLSWISFISILSGIFDYVKYLKNGKNKH